MQYIFVYGHQHFEAFADDEAQGANPKLEFTEYASYYQKDLCFFTK